MGQNFRLGYTPLRRDVEIQKWATRVANARTRPDPPAVRGIGAMANFFLEPSPESSSRVGSMLEADGGQSSALIYKPMLRWRDLRHAGVMALEHKSTRCDDAVQILQRRHTEGFRIGCARLSDTPDNIPLKFHKRTKVSAALAHASNRVPQAARWFSWLTMVI